MVHMYQRRRVLVSVMDKEGWKKDEGRIGVSVDILVTVNFVAADSEGA